jgi:hypothetical protein
MGRPQKRPRAELIQLLADQRRTLASSCENYDKGGNDWEAPRLAATVFNLVHDHGRIKSSLTRLGLKAGLRFVSSNRVSPNEPGVLTMVPPLLVFGGKGLEPILGRGPPDWVRMVQFHTWWEELIYEDAGLSLTRKRMVFSLRNQDGGGHVGELTDPAYIKFKGPGNFWGGAGTGFDNVRWESIVNGIAASMRQVAWEVDETLKQLGEVRVG